ncbi:fungal-specific transcription factor domain-containing protein [Dichomitus squalens]|uniref:Fungal-specific transcription factor domain-containing protein n=1 Tax=Dichomitus squalens TaxID=114155 RepID=A0A4Q9PVY1_9APHY|nr:fungal-specific transcription factor domain-containing protein [Dichomitus squalens]
MTTDSNPTPDPTDNPLSTSQPLPPPSMTIPHPPKKKRVDDQGPLAPDLGTKPIQLQRRRVWRACESCRCVRAPSSTFMIVAAPSRPPFLAFRSLPSSPFRPPPHASFPSSRRKKIKCDGSEPTCSQCASSKSQCTWLQTKDRAALSRHYVQELEARLLHMEGIFQQILPILDQVSQATGLDLTAISAAVSSQQGSSSSAAQSTAGAVPDVMQSFLPRIHEGQAIGNRSDSRSTSGHGSDDDLAVKIEDDVSNALGQLALDEHGHLHWIGNSSTMSLIQRLKEATTSPLHRVSPMEEDPLAPGPSVNKLYFPASVYFGKVRALPRPEEVEYPERDLADKLVDAYFARFHFLMPVLDKPEFMRRYRFLMDHPADTKFVREHTPFVALVCAVFAVASRFVDDPRLKTSDNLDEAGMGMVYHERALILHYISAASMQVEHVQCFLLMSSFLCSVNCLPQAWLLVGQAVRAAQDIGLHRSPRRLLISPIEKETRRKIWWGVYTLDRMLALALGRPLAIEDADCDVEIPVELDDELLPQYFAGALLPQGQISLMRGFIELISLYRIAGRVLREVYALDKCKDHLEMDKRAELQRSVETLDRRLTKWCEDLPTVFKSNPSTEKQVSMAAVLCSHYYSILTTLHRNFIPVKGEQPFAPRSTAKAVSTARACVRLAPSIKNVVPPSHHLAFFVQNLFSSAVIILLYAMHTTEAQAAQAALEEARSCLAVLESWEGQWPGARKCKELLEDLTAKACEAIRSASNGQPRGSTSDASSFAAAGTSAHSPSSSMHPDGRSHVTSASISGPIPERLIRGKPRRNRSRDVPLSPRNAHAPSQFRPDCECFPSSSLRLRVFLRVDQPLLPNLYHVILTSDSPPSHARPLLPAASATSSHVPTQWTALRARSTSRKRPHDEDLFQDQYGNNALGLPSSYPGRSTLAANMSSHSSPVSVNSHPSPPGPSQHAIDKETSPSMMHANASYATGPLSLAQSPTVQIPGQRFDYDGFGLGSPATDKWASPVVDGNELKFFPSGSGSQQNNASSMGGGGGGASAFGHGHSRGFSGQLPGLDTSPPYLGGFDGSEFSGGGGMGGFGGSRPPGAGAGSTGATGTTPPSAGFVAPGLPFHGLDFIRNYDPAGNAGAGPSAFASNDHDWNNNWQSSFDTFGVDPETAFTLGGDFTTDGQWGNGGQ